MSWFSDTTGGAATTQLLGMIGGHGQERRNYRNNRKLMELQHQNQMGLNRQGHDLQMDMWNKTNYGAQVQHMKDAGLNPALMYKGAGAGGTTGSQGGGSASMGSSQQGKVMDLQNALLGAQIDGIKAKAESDRANAQDKLGNTPLAKANIAGVKQSTLEAVERTSNLKKENDIMELKRQVDEVVRDRAKNGTVKGDVIGNILEVAGLDPKNNPEHQALLWGLFGVQYGARVFKDLMQGFFAKKGFNVKGDNINTTNNNSFPVTIGGYQMEDNVFISKIDTKQEIY